MKFFYVSLIISLSFSSEIMLKSSSISDDEDSDMFEVNTRPRVVITDRAHTVTKLHTQFSFEYFIIQVTERRPEGVVATA